MISLLLCQILVASDLAERFGFQASIVHAYTEIHFRACLRQAALRRRTSRKPPLTIYLSIFIPSATQSAFTREELEAAAAAAAAAAAERYLQLGVPRERVRVVASREEVEAAGRALAAADAIGVDAEWCAHVITERLLRPCVSASTAPLSLTDIRSHYPQAS